MTFDASRNPRAPRSVIPVSLAALLYLSVHARPDEVEQYVALTGADYDPEVAAVAFWRARACSAMVIHEDGTPAAAGGYEEVMPGVWQSWMVGTPRGWAEKWVDIHRATRFITEALVCSGRARRLQTNALAKRTAACAWYLRLGLKPEGVMRGAGRGGEDVALFGRSLHEES